MLDFGATLKPLLSSQLEAALLNLDASSARARVEERRAQLLASQARVHRLQATFRGIDRDARNT
jgi:multidrug resistance efflux pump